MFRKLLLSITAASLITFSGCAVQHNDSPLPSRRPLGRNFSAYHTSDKPSQDSSEDTSIAEPTGIIKLHQALAYALLHNPDLAVYSWQMRVTEAMELQAGLLPNPKFGVTVEEFGGTGESNGLDAAETTLQLSQLIELGGKRSKRTRIASLESRLAGWDYEAKRLEVFSKVANAFVDVLAAQKQLELTNELTQLSQKVLTTVSQRVESGKDSPA